MSISRRSYPILHLRKTYFLWFNLYPLLAMSKYCIICKSYICILWLPSKDNDLLKWFWDMLLLYDELLYMQIYVETVNLKSKVLIFDYGKCISYLLIDWLMKSGSINWKNKISANNATSIWLFQLRVLSPWYVEDSWSLFQIFISFRCHWIIWADEKASQQFCPLFMTVQSLRFLIS